MTTKTTLAELLQWRMAQAEQDAPPAPRAARLLDLARPWWETYPEKFRALSQRLAALQMGYGHAMVDAGVAFSVAPVVPALVIAGEEIDETCVRTLYFDVTNVRLRMRFAVDFVPSPSHAMLDVTFVTETDLQPIFTVTAWSSMANEYWLETVLPENRAREWAALKVTSRMPFRLLLRPETSSD